MAHALRFKPEGAMLSSQLDSIAITVDGDYVDVEIVDRMQTRLVTERYYAYQGKATIYDFAKLTESYMRENWLSYTDFTIYLYRGDELDDSHSYKILYCDRYTECTDTDTFLAENFLTTLSTRRVAPDDTLQLGMFAKEGESKETLVRYCYRVVGDDTIRTAEFKMLENITVKITAVSYVYLFVPDLYKKAATIEQLPKELIEMVSFDVFCGQRSFTAYIDQSLRMKDSFIFRNCFNCWEYASLPYTTKSKTKVERNIAKINQRSKFYNQRTEKTYEVEMGPLSLDEAEWIGQMFTSYVVMRYVPTYNSEEEDYFSSEILLTDADCEYSYSDDKPNTVKFTWRYANNRPIAHLKSPVGNFTSPFNINYN